MSRRQEQYRRDQAGGERDLGPGTGGRSRASHRLEPVHLRGDTMQLSLTRMLCESLRRFNNHGEGSY